MSAGCVLQIDFEMLSITANKSHEFVLKKPAPFPFGVPEPVRGTLSVTSFGREWEGVKGIEGDWGGQT